MSIAILKNVFQKVRDSLKLQLGQVVSVSPTQLERVKKLELQPIEGAFFSAEDHKSLLEAYIRTHLTTITQKDCLELRYLDHVLMKILFFFFLSFFSCY